VSASSEPQFRSLGLPEKHITRVFAAPGFDAWILLDAAILGALAYGVWRRSRVCALLLLTYGIVNEVYLAFQETGHFSILRLIFIYFYFRGTIQLFREHRSSATSQVIRT